MSKGNISLQKVRICDLEEKTKSERGVIRVGATGREPEVRAKEYEGKGYSGKMFYAETTNMKLAENKLLQLASENEAGRHNDHQNSNVGNQNGYVYIIQGKKFN